jgi:hypothetical protein
MKFSVVREWGYHSKQCAAERPAESWSQPYGVGFWNGGKGKFSRLVSYHTELYCFLGCVSSAYLLLQSPSNGALGKLYLGQGEIGSLR